MSVIAVLSPARDGGWTGTIRTLTINTRVKFVPNENRANDKAPAFRIFAGSSRVGDAWKARSGGNKPKDYFRVRLDDPSLAEPLSAALFTSDDGKSAEMIWNRRQASEGKDKHAE